MQRIFIDCKKDLFFHFQQLREKIACSKPRISLCSSGNTYKNDSGALRDPLGSYISNYFGLRLFLKKCGITVPSRTQAYTQNIYKSKKIIFHETATRFLMVGVSAAAQSRPHGSL